MAVSRNVMQYKFSSPAGHLEVIETFLNTHAVPDSKELDKILKQLFKIKRSFARALTSPGDPLKQHFNEQNELIQKLAGRCHKLQERRDVIDLAEEAENLANNSPNKSDKEVAIEANHLRKRIDAFVQGHRPSRNDAKFIRFARACIAKAEKHEPLLVKKSPKQISIESIEKNIAEPHSPELAESLYELASLLYQGKIEDFQKSLKNNFSIHAQKEICYHASLCGGKMENLSKKEQRLKVIQGILGYAHILADYYMDNTPYPPTAEIHAIFKDLDLVNHLEEADLQAGKSQISLSTLS